MSSVTEIESAIRRLSAQEFDELQERVDDLMQDAWDRQMQRDAAAGRLDALMAEASEDFEAGRCEEL